MSTERTEETDATRELLPGSDGLQGPTNTRFTRHVLAALALVAALTLIVVTVCAGGAVPVPGHVSFQPNEEAVTYQKKAGGCRTEDGGFGDYSVKNGLDQAECQSTCTSMRSL